MAGIEPIMIKRIWHGFTAPERADEYEALLRKEVIKGIENKNIPGFRKIEVLRRQKGDETEFITIIEFENIESVKAFVGDDYEQCYVPDEARKVLSRFDDRSQHYELRDVRSYA
jgi:antibiotic biosynthesis monooxygenase (ABM) superfamily enzyme